MKINQAFSEAGLAKHIRKTDFKKHPYLMLPANRQQLLDSAMTKLGSSGSFNFRTLSNQLGKNLVYSLPDLSDELIHRKASRNVRFLTKVKQSNRNNIIDNIISLLEENMPFRIYKLDIEKFYDNLSSNHILESLRNDTGISKVTSKVIEGLLLPFNGGLPRGLEISAVLAEREMRAFDKFAKAHSEVYFYARFVDDIIVVTSSIEKEATFLSKLKEMLPKDTNFNSKKHYVETIEATNKQNCGAKVCSFNYLGYDFEVLNPVSKPTKSPRIVCVDISTSKIAKLKTKIVKAGLAYINDNDFVLFSKRMQLLVSNYKILEHNSNQLTLAGIYYNYRHIQHSDYKGLHQLDRFMRSFLLGNKSSLSKKLRIALSKPQKRELLQKSFLKGHVHRTFIYFSPTELMEIKKCWNHG